MSSYESLGALPSWVSAAATALPSSAVLRPVRVDTPITVEKAARSPRMQRAEASVRDMIADLRRAGQTGQLSANSRRFIQRFLAMPYQRLYETIGQVMYRGVID